jgi:hypothetical protein
MVNSNNKLEIFENFQIDYNLPKYDKNKTVDVGLTGSIPTSINNSTFIMSSGTNTVSNMVFGGTIGVPQSWVEIGSAPDANDDNTKTKKVPFWKKWFEDKKNKKIEKQRTMTIVGFFSSLAKSLNDLKTLQDIAIHYETAITNARNAGQTALVDKLITRLESAKSEAQLVMVKLNKYILEEQIVDFYKKTNKDKNLKLTWIKHFIKPIPSKILDVKKDLDEQLIFDNYVVLHYDPNNDATDLSNEEKEEIIRRKKDPILFGVLKNSRRLYYVGDWIDDYCDLTLDVVIETLGEKVSVLNNETVKTYIDRGERIDERVKLPNPNAVSASTYQMPVFFEKVKEEGKKIVKKLTAKKTTKKKK